jgi:hypothetical protein
MKIRYGEMLLKVLGFGGEGIIGVEMLQKVN